MKQKLLSGALAAILLFTTSCASIVSKSNYPVTLHSYPSEAKVTITDKKGEVVYSGQTPAQVKLKSGAGFFSKAHYDVTFEKEGYATSQVPVEFKLDGWYFGNILFGGFIGLLIVDPATGAMYKLDTEIIEHNLPTDVVKEAVNKDGVSVIDINNIPEDYIKHLESVDLN